MGSSKRASEGRRGGSRTVSSISLLRSLGMSDGAPVTRGGGFPVCGEVGSGVLGAGFLASVASSNMAAERAPLESTSRFLSGIGWKNGRCLSSEGDNFFDERGGSLVWSGEFLPSTLSRLASFILREG